MPKSLFDEAEKIDQSEIPAENLSLPGENASPESFDMNGKESGNVIEMPLIEEIEGKQAARQNTDNIAANANDDLPNVNFILSTPFESKNETTKKAVDEPLLFQMESSSESSAETARKSGLAMSAAIALFGSVVFLLVIGWFADLLLGTSPWGIVGGIVLGSIVGFFQFFRTTSQILKNKD